MKELKFSPTTKEDWMLVKKLAEDEEFPLPDFNNVVVHGVIKNGSSDVVAFGIVKAFAEAIIVVDRALPRVTRAQAMRELMKVALYGTEKAGIQQLHLFVEDKKLAKILIKHFGFKLCESIVLVRTL